MRCQWVKNILNQFQWWIKGVVWIQCKTNILLWHNDYIVKWRFLFPNGRNHDMPKPLCSTNILIQFTMLWPSPPVVLFCDICAKSFITFVICQLMLKYFLTVNIVMILVLCQINKAFQIKVVKYPIETHFYIIVLSLEIALQ